MARQESASSPRRRSKGPPACGYTFDELVCSETGDHYCAPRAERVVAFFAEILVHTKGDWARSAFTLADWQADEIVRPLFGTVVWSTYRKRYVRQYHVAYIILGRKNGKSELAAGIALYLLIGDDEEAAEIYGAAKDRDQARKVWDVAERMRTLSELLNSDKGGRLGVNKNQRRIFDEKTASYYDVITSDALGELGHNPHGAVIDELLAQDDPAFFNAMRTAFGTRAQALMVVLTTETDDPSGFCAQTIDEAERIIEDPGRAPHVFAYVRRIPRTEEDLETLHRVHAGHPDLPVSTDVWDERNWKWPNPALDDFLDRQALREEATEARNEPAKENPFRQYRGNQRVSQTSRWMPLHLWDATAGMFVDESKLAGKACYAGLDLASTTDLAAWALFFPGGGTESDPHQVLWRFWTPEAQVAKLDRYTGNMFGVWVREGFITATEGDWIDYDTIHEQIAKDKAAFRIVKVGYDPKDATATAQYMQKLNLEIEKVYQGFSLSPSLKEIMRLVKAGALQHGGHPVARYCADSVEIKRNDEDKIKLVKPDRGATGKRIDGLAALATAINPWQYDVMMPEPASGGEATGTDDSTVYRPRGRLDI